MTAVLYPVGLSEEQRERLEQIAYRSGPRQAPLRQIIIARALLKAADGQNDPAISDALDIARNTVAGLRRKFCSEGLDACLNRKEQANRKRKVTGEVEAHIVALACSKPPEGQARWSLRLLADRVVELQILEDVSHETVREVLKKTSSSRGRRSASALHRKQTVNS